MFKSILCLTERKLCQQYFRGISTPSAWDIVTSVCIERLPVVTPPLNEIQMKYLKLLQKIEVENSLKSDHELRHENDTIQAELLKSESADIDLEAASKVTAQDFEDFCNDEFAKFKFADIETEADKKGDKNSPERCLQRHLVLVAPIKIGNEHKTLLPQALWREGETLRQTAERIVNEQFKSDENIKILGNAPCGFYKYKYPTEIEGKIGAKVFFYYANYKPTMTSKKESDNSKLEWLTRKELDEVLPMKYNKYVKQFLIDESY